MTDITALGHGITIQTRRNGRWCTGDVKQNGAARTAINTPQENTGNHSQGIVDGPFEGE
jgi:hypothetical protein